MVPSSFLRHIVESFVKNNDDNVVVDHCGSITVSKVVIFDGTVNILIYPESEICIFTVLLHLNFALFLVCWQTMQIQTLLTVIALVLDCLHLKSINSISKYRDTMRLDMLEHCCVHIQSNETNRI